MHFSRRVRGCGDGVYVDWGFGLKISNNVIHNNTVGLYAEIGGTFEYCEVVGNNFTANTAFGIFDYAQYSRGNRIYFNNFIGNSASAFALPRKNVWDNGYPLRSNYWSDYEGEDTYRGLLQDVGGMDGLGDTPYGIGGTNGTCMDRYPLKCPWSRPRNREFECRGWNVYVSMLWNASSGWRDRRGDVTADGIVNIFDTVKVSAAYGSRIGDSNWDPTCDLNGDGKVDIYDLVIVSGDYGKTATRLTGAYSWYSNGSPSSNFTMWQQLDTIEDLRNHTVRFSFYFRPDATAQTATAMIYCATVAGEQWIVGTPVNGAAQQ
ncbi:MAG: NosD domain-containing protein, partial [Candidatus Bathyarchaeia archaeon]